ncbi:MAG: HPF/RaiA family ribosome-associated protein [Planctomycetia bacterium]|jgi:ribosome-associated translation inhibitor RaiA|nr:HPF/RaiA family ribosome-associated protein [Planctomycetia bacterium]
MQVKVIGDNHVRGTAGLAQEVETSVEAALKRFGQQITRVEAHLSDENSHKRGDNDKQCTLEAHVAGLQAIAATGNGSTLNQAVHESINKLVAQLDHKLGRLGERKGRTAMGGEEE